MTNDNDRFEASAILWSFALVLSSKRTFVCDVGSSGFGRGMAEKFYAFYFMK